jgi:quinohemoprotein ethanol dehydrogenase
MIKKFMVLPGLLALAVLLVLYGAKSPAAGKLDTAAKTQADIKAAAVSAKRLLSASADAGNWLTHGRTYSEQRYSPLSQINAANAASLGVAWSTSLESLRGIEATPLVVDGVMYTTGSWSVVFALDARTGEKLWKYDPQVPRSKAKHACCDVVNRGVAVYEGKVFVGTLDGRLVALNANTGRELWSTRTFAIEEARTITGAPRVVKGKVIIGHGGGEFGVRGFVAAYDADNGEQVWKFYTVPGNPADGFENDTMKMAAETWTGEWWTLGGGGTVWDSMAFDPELDLLYIGVGNGSPWNQAVRSPEGGDNLFLSSIVAVRPDTGKYVWHYQTTPGETWDFTATQPIILADMVIKGAERKVLMQAPKNGFFYVLDRNTGKLISAENFVPVNWAQGVDVETGRPIENPEARYGAGSAMVMPTPFGAHNWHPMSYSPDTGLVYLSSQELPFVYKGAVDAKYIPDGWNTKTDFRAGELPETEAERRGLAKQLIKGNLLAWDPVAQKEVWRVEYDKIWNGGTLATAGNLVFQGRADQSFAAFNAQNGELIWQLPMGTGMVGGPISYEVDGEQYIAVSAGWGSGLHLLGGYFVGPKAGPVNGHMVAFKLNGQAELGIKQPPARAAIAKPPLQTADEATIAAGGDLFYSNCWMCHGDAAISAGTTPDLRYSHTLGNEDFYAFVLQGISQNGMPNFSGRLSREETESIQAYVLSKAWAAWDDQQSISSNRVLTKSE